MSRTNLPVRIIALEQAAPEAARAWVRMIIPEGMTSEEREALVAAEKKKHPAGTGFVVRVIV